MSSGRVRAVFGRSEAALGHSLPIRKTRGGIWVPTPLPVIEAACEVLTRIGALGADAPYGPVVDAGTGDGRVPIFLSRCDPGRLVYGIELDAPLCAQATENLEMLESDGLVDAGTHVRLVEGDYTDVETYAAAGLDLGATHLFINYPDGNQRPLERLIAERSGPRTELCLLTHDRTIELDVLVLREQQEVKTKGEPAWQLSIYRQP